MFYFNFGVNRPKQQQQQQKRNKIFNSYRKSKRSLTRFEDLSNDIFYEIFNFLDFCHVHQAFFNLNNRFKNLFNDPTLPIQINLSSISKSTFQRCLAHILFPYQHRITLLHVSNPLIIDRILSPVTTALKLNRLQKLSLDNINSTLLKKVLIQLNSLSCLHSLIINCVNEDKNTNDLYLRLFRLPALKYCKLSIEGCFRLESSTIETARHSPIQYLTIDSAFDIDDLSILLSYIPQIRHLKFHHLCGSLNKSVKSNRIILNDLTHVSLNINEITFDDFNLIAKNLFYQVKNLHISINYDHRAYLDAKKWEQLILSYIPYLQIFDIQYKELINTNNQLEYDILVDQFQTQFWVQRQWFFQHHIHMNEYQGYFIFYSINPNRKKQYVLHEDTMKSNTSYDNKSNVNSAHDIDIENEKMIISCKTYFPNATKLTLRCNSNNESEQPLSTILNHILPLKQLTQLSVDSLNIHFEVIIELLHFLPNIHTLMFNPDLLNKIDLVSIQENKTFQIVSNTNIIKNMIIKSSCTFQQLKLLINLCPQIQQLSMCIQKIFLEMALQFLLSKDNKYTHELHSLCITHSIGKGIEIVNNLLQLEKRLDVRVMEMKEYQGCNIYLWW